MKQRNPRWGCPRIARQIQLAFRIPINKDVVRRILAAHYHPSADGSGPSWLTFIGHAKDSLHSVDLFRCESVALRTYWVLVVMDQYTRRIIGFGIHAGIVDGRALCRMFNRAIRWQAVPKYLSSDHDPLYRFHQWQANLRVLGVREIKTVPFVPLSHPFVERLIGTIRGEYLDQTVFWTATDLENKLVDFQHYFNQYRTHAGLNGRTPEPRNRAGCSAAVSAVIDGSGIVVGCTRRPRPPDVRIRHRHLGRAYDSRFEFVIQADRQNKRRARREAALKFGRFPRNAVSVNYPRPGTEEISRTRHFRAPGTRGNRAGHATENIETS